MCDLVIHNVHVNLSYFCLALPFGSSVDLLATKDPEEETKDEEETPIYQKYDNLLQGGKNKKE